MKNLYFRLFLIVALLSPTLTMVSQNLRDTILIDFGDILSPAPWNNFTTASAGSLDDLLTKNGISTGYAINVNDAFNGINQAGTTAANPALGIPGTASGDSFFGNTVEFSGKTEPTGGVELTGLDATKTYELTIFASRTATDNRETKYVIDGATQDILYLNVASNVDNVVISNMKPNAEGKININASPGPNNTNGSGFFYLGTLAIGYDLASTPKIDTVYIDFGDILSPAPWNNFTNPTDGNIEDLLSSNGKSAGFGISIYDPFNNINQAGTTTPDPALGFPATASGDSFFGNTVDFGGKTEPTGGVALNHLVPGKFYDIDIFASRTATDNRETKYVIEGNTTDTLYLNVASNTGMVVSSHMAAAADGTIRIGASPGPNNNNGSGFYYLGLLKVTYERVIPTDTVYIDFGDILTPSPWNNLSNATDGSIAALQNSKGFGSGFGIQVFDAFNGINQAGTTTPDASLGYPSTATGDSFFGNTVEFSGKTEPTGGVELINLLPGKAYEIEIFASRTATDNRETQYVIEGSAVDTLYLNVASNTGNVVKSKMVASNDGTIKVTASPGPNNTNGSGFFYLGVMKVVYENDSEIQEGELSLSTPNGGEFWQVGKTPTIYWDSKNAGDVKIEYSTDNGGSWASIATVPAVQKSYKWTVPNEPSKNCLVRISSDNLSDVSEQNFEISSSATSCKIVVLGSSTAAGTGPSSPDSTWVNRYKRYLNKNTKFEVINLAVGGYTTYHILPTGTAIPSGVNITIDVAHNVTKALTYEPYAIIVNMPSNDAVNNFPVSDQMKNFALVANEAASKGAQTWICTTQPRNFSLPSQIQIQRDVRDSIFAVYGDHAIDFWTGIADESTGFILPELNSGDGVHLNNKGHGILIQKILAAQIDTIECGMPDAVIDHNTNGFGFQKVYPNPNDGNFTMELYTNGSSQVDIKLIDMLGRIVDQRKYTIQNSGVQQLTWQSNSNNFETNMLYALIQVTSGGLVSSKAIPMMITK